MKAERILTTNITSVAGCLYLFSQFMRPQIMVEVTKATQELMFKRLHKDVSSFLSNLREN